jgi:hypothetical protein
VNFITAVITAALMIITAATACYILATARDTPRGKHARRDPDGDPADTGDPDGSNFIAALHAEPPDLTTLTRVRDRLTALPPQPPGDTRPLPHADSTWGMTPHELADHLARTYLEVTQ